jgi:hypothetical protein
MRSVRDMPGDPLLCRRILRHAIALVPKAIRFTHACNHPQLNSSLPTASVERKSSLSVAKVNPYCGAR